MSQTAEKISEMKIPKFMRKKFFRTYSYYYKVKLEEIVEPLDSFTTFSAFFTRKVHPRKIN
jgi:phosphatidylserine decarboxylase